MKAAKTRQDVNESEYMLIKGVSSQFIAILERRSKDVIKMSGLTAAVIRQSKSVDRKTQGRDVFSLLGPRKPGNEGCGKLLHTWPHNQPNETCK